MKYCIEFNKNSKYLQQADELIINYHSSETSFAQFLEEHKNQTIHMAVAPNDIQDFIDNEIAVLASLRAQGLNNFYVRIPFDNNLIKILQDNSIPFWLNKYVNNWDVLNWYLSLGVSYVTIIEDICFDMAKVSQLIHNAGAKVRVYPNIAQTAASAYTPAIKKFFIRPEDMFYFEDYVDVCDFFDTANREHQDTYYKIYAIDKQWFGNLREIIIDLGKDIDNRCIFPAFAISRANCNKTCMKGGKCKLCERYEHLAGTLKDNDFIIEKIKN